MDERLRYLQENAKADDSKRRAFGPRRIKSREKTMRVGEITLETGRTVSCVVRDVSDTGMRLSLSEFSEVPDSFRLRAPTLEFDEVVLVVWRSGDEIGVSYT